MPEDQSELENGEVKATDKPNGDANRKIRAFRLFSIILERHPGSWLIAGIALLVISTGSVRWGRFSLDLSQNMTPLLRGCFIILGVFLFLLGCFLIVQTQITNRTFLTVIFASVWMIFVGITFYTIGTSTGKGEHAIVSYGYSYEDKAFGVTLKPSALRNYLGSSFVLVVRKENTKCDAVDDCQIAISELHHIPESSSPDCDFECTCTNISKDIKPGDMTECHLVVVPSTINLKSVQRISDLIKYGGKEISAVGNKAMPDPTVCGSLADCYSQLSDNDKILFKKLIGLDLRPQQGNSN